MNSSKMSLNFGKSKEMGSNSPPPQEGEMEEPKDYAQDLMEIKNLLMSGDIKSALKLIDQCLSGKEEENEPMDKEGAMNAALDSILSKKG